VDLRKRRPRPWQRLTRGQLTQRAALTAAGLLIAQAAIAFAVQGLWWELSSLWLCPVLWVFAAGMVPGLAEYLRENDLIGSRRVTARYARTETGREGGEDGVGSVGGHRFVEVYRLPAGDGRTIEWRRHSRRPRDAPGVRRVWLVPGVPESRAESTGSFALLTCLGLLLVCLTVGFALAGTAAAAFCLLGPWLL
jgi:hypothetical protein